jgi:hypothetical protein
MGEYAGEHGLDGGVDTESSPPTFALGQDEM